MIAAWAVASGLLTLLSLIIALLALEMGGASQPPASPIDRARRLRQRVELVGRPYDHATGHGASRSGLIREPW